MQFSHHSSNPLELHTSDATGARYRQNVANAMHGDSSDELGRWSDKTAYQSHVSRVVGVNLGTLVIPPYRGRPATPVAGPSRQLVQEYVDLDDDMESEDELATPFKEDYARSTREASKNAQHLFDEEEIVVDEEVGNDEDAEGEDEQIVNPEEVPMEEDEGLTYVEQTWEDDMQAEDYGDIEDDDNDAIMSPLTPLSDDEDGLNSIQFHPEWSSPQSSRPPSPDETRTLFSRSLEEQAEIQEEMQDLCENVPVLAENYELLDRLGTGTFSSVYKALDLKYDEYDNHAWQGTHPANSSAYYQRAGPSYRGRGGRRSTKEEAVEEDEEDGENQHPGGVNDGKAFVAIKRIYTTSGPDRIKNEVAIMEDCRGARHVSQIITAFRELDQVVIVLPYQRNLDFRDYFQTLHPEGIKCYFRCLFRALNDIHRRGIIHRDVKPANFLFDPFTGIGTLCDFGLASRMETPPHVGECLHRPWSEDHPHGQNYSQSEQDIERIKKAQRKARNNSRNPPEKVGYPENDRRPISKANRAGTRGFRAPEVLLKCGAQTGAIDVWSAGIILLFFLTGKFPIFQSNDDIEGLMEIAVIIGKKKLEMAATLHGRIVSTNVPGLETEGINWQTFVERLNPEVGTPKKYDMRFYPHNCKHRDGPTSSLRAATAQQQQQVKTEEDPPAPDRLADALAEAIASVKAEQVEEDADVKVKTEPASTPAIPPPDSAASTAAPTTAAPTTATPAPPSPADRYANPRAPEIHKRDMKHAFYLLEKVLNVEATKRYTPGQALGLAWLEEPAIGPDSQFVPLLPGEGVCRRWHHHDAARRVDQVFVRRVCRCSELEERRVKELEREEREQEERVRWMEEAEKEEQEEQEEKLQILGSDGEVLSSEADPLQFPERESSPTVTESKILDVFDDEYELAVDPRLERLPVKRCCERTIVRDLVAGEGISFGDEPCEFHTDDFYRNQFIYRVAEDV